MSTLLMVQERGDVLLGWDSQLTKGNQITYMKERKFWAQGEVVYGVGGLVRAKSLLESSDLPTYDYEAKPRDWVVQQWVPAIRKVLRGETSLTDDDGDMTGWNLFMVVGGEAFTVDTMFDPAQSESGLYAMGSGSEFALGALTVGATISEALRAAETLDVYTGGMLWSKRASEFLNEKRNV